MSYEFTKLSEVPAVSEFPEGANTIIETNGEIKRCPSSGGSGGGSGGVTTLHINVTAVNRETMEATFTADKTPAEMNQASVNGPIWCVVTFAAGTMAQEAVSIGVPPAWYGGQPAFGERVAGAHNGNGNNTYSYVVREATSDSWRLDITQFGG